MLPSPKDLDAQCLVKLDGWVDFGSERHKEVDSDYALTKKWLKMGLESPPFLFLDLFGRVWGKGVNGIYFPLHLEYGKKLLGIRLPKKAAN